MIFLVQFRIGSARKFFKDYKLHSPYELVQFSSPLLNALLLIYPKLHSKSCDYLYKSNEIKLTFRRNTTEAYKMLLTRGLLLLMFTKQK